MTDTFQEKEFARATVNITNTAGMGGAPKGGRLLQTHNGSGERLRTLSCLSDEYSRHFLMAQCHPHFDPQAYTGLRFCPEWPGSTASNPTLKNLRQEHCRFDASLAYIARVTRKETYPSCSKTTATGKQSRSPTVRKQQELVYLFFQIIWEINFNLNLTFFKIEVIYEGELHPSK